MFSLPSFTDKSELLREVQRRIQNPARTQGPAYASRSENYELTALIVQC